VKEPLWYNPSLSCIGNLKILHSQPFAAANSMQKKQVPREPVLLMALKIILHAKLCLSYLRVLASRKDMQGTV